MATSYGQITMSKLEETYSVILSNESHTFSASSSAALAGSTESSVFAYKGDERVAATIGTISGKPTGMSVSISNNGTINAKFTVTVTTSMTTKNGVLTIPITVDGNSFEKKFSYSLAISGTSVTVSSIAYAYQLSTNGTTPPTGTWQDNPVAPTTTQYAWTRTIVTYSDGSKATSYTVGGKTGTNGSSVTVTNTAYAYQLSTSGTTPPTGTWSDSPVAPTSTQYAWTRTTTTFSDNSTAVTYTVGGKTGTNGSSITVSNTTYAYQLSTSGTTIPTGTWSSTPVAPTATQFAWTRTITTFSDGSKATTYTVGGRIGDTGATGKGVSSIVKQYYLSTSNTGQSGGSWSATPETYVSGRYYWVRDYITWTDGSTTTSEAVLDNGLNSANSKAEQAQSTATSAQTTANTALAQSVEYIAGTQTAITGNWKGVTADSQLVVGKTIAYKLPYAGSGNASLQLTLGGGSGGTSDNIPVYLNTTRVTTHFGAGAIINMTYDGTAWRASSIPNTDNYDRVLLNNDITAVTAITAGRIICGTDEGYKNIGSEVSFDLGYPLLYAEKAISANSTGSSNYLSYPSVNASANGIINGGAIKKTLYLKGTISANTFTIASSEDDESGNPSYYLTTVIPTEEDSSFYIPLGIMYSATEIYFNSTNKLYALVNGSFQAVDSAGQLLALNSIDRLNQLEPIVAEHTTSFETLEESIRSEVAENYVRSDDFSSYTESQSSVIEQLSDSITATFESHQSLIDGIDSDLDEYKTDISKYIRFSADGIEIGDIENTNHLTLKIDNDEIGFYKGNNRVAYWDGDTLRTGNAYIDVNMQFRLGNFAAFPRSDGSLSWLKVN